MVQILAVDDWFEKFYGVYRCRLRSRENENKGMWRIKNISELFIVNLSEG